MISIAQIGIINWGIVPRERVNQYIERQVVHGNDLTIVKLFMQAGASVQKHLHPNEQLTWILDGRINFMYGENLEKSVILTAGDILHLPANIPHTAICLEDTIDFDIFTPVRSDWERPDGNNYFSSSKNVASL
ncbi:cupin domain-containing protein [Salmonella enterica]|nr:cupin domain-containing protein [Salmonella enterica]